MEHLKYAVNLAKEKPMVFGPAVVEILITFVSQRIILSWTVYNDFVDAMLDYFYSQTGVSPVSYTPTGFEFDYTRFISWVTVGLILLSLLSWVASLASIRACWRAVRGEEPTLQESFLYVGGRVLSFVFASILLTLFFVVASGVAVIPLFLCESMGFGPAFLIFFVVIVGVVVAAVLSAPTFIVMIGEDGGFVPSLRRTLRFTRGSFWTYIGLGILLVLMAFVLTLVPYVGYYLSSIVGAVSNIAIIDLYNSYRAASEL